MSFFLLAKYAITANKSPRRNQNGVMVVIIDITNVINISVE